jgi:hypothetical protein
MGDTENGPFPAFGGTPPGSRAERPYPWGGAPCYPQRPRCLSKPSTVDYSEQFHHTSIPDAGYVRNLYGRISGDKSPRDGPRRPFPSGQRGIPAPGKRRRIPFRFPHHVGPPDRQGLDIIIPTDPPTNHQDFLVCDVSLDIATLQPFLRYRVRQIQHTGRRFPWKGCTREEPHETVHAKNWYKERRPNP